MPDISRSTFRREKHYDTVRMQQGRVLLDADQNESEDIHRYLRETTALDIIGRTGVPRDNPGFRIVAGPGGEPLISAGRMYVDGILVENEGTFRVAGTSPSPVPDNDALDPDLSIEAASPSARIDTIVAPGGGGGGGGPQPIVSLTLDDTSALLAKGAFVEVFATTNGQPAATTHTITARSGKTIGIQPSLAAGATVHLVRAMVPWSKQPDFFGGKLPNGNYLLYLDVWRREITHLEDPEIREVALGGPDTTTRTKTVWQVRALANGTCPGFTSPRKNDARMAAKAVAPGKSKPCEIPEAAGYRRLENQLYRIQIHKSGGNGVATFKWSRENGAIVFPLDPKGNDAAKIDLLSIGLDERTSLHDNDWVEVINDLNDLDAKPGQLVRVKSAPQTSSKIVTLDGSITGPFDRAKNARLRVWGDPDASTTTGDFTVDTSKFVELEDGIQVRFSGTEFNSGDYWLVPARTAISEDTGTVLWPLDDTKQPRFLPPEGIAHHYAPLAEVSGSIVKDCRRIFAPITTPDLFYVSGEGQNVKPDANGGLKALPCKLRVRVSNGTPIEGTKVTFTLPPGQTGSLVPDTQATGADGIIACQWSVNAKDADQYATATLDLPGVTHAKPSILFHAQLDFAEDDCVCMIVIHEGDDVAKRFEELKSRQYVDICFETGNFDLDEPLVLQGKKGVKVTGAGAGTRIRGSKNVAIEFMECEDVLVRDLTASATAVVGFALFVPSPLLFIGCGDVTVERVESTCATAGAKGEVGCITASTCTNVSIRESGFSAGTDQYGIVVAEADVVVIEGNRIVGRPRGGRFLPDLGTLLGDIQATPTARRTRRGRTGAVRIGAVELTFGAEDEVVGDVARLIAETDVSNVRTEEDARRVLTDAIAGLAADPARLERFPDLGRRFELRDRGGAAYGIFTQAFSREDMKVTIRDNDIRGANVGIQVNPFASAAALGALVARAEVLDNHVTILAAQLPARGPDVDPVITNPATGEVGSITAAAFQLPPPATGTPLFGIAFGSCGSMLVEGNFIVSAWRVNSLQDDIRHYAIAGVGTFGPFSIVRSNDVRNFMAGVYITPTTVPELRQWRIIANLAVGAWKAWTANGWTLENNVPPV
jgi:Family of unknown function (DUF6519)